MQDNVTQAVDWDAPLEAYHPDGTVVAVGIDPHYHSLDRGKPDSDGEFRIIGLPEVAAPYFNKAGEHWASSTWRIRNRLASTAQPEVKALVEAVERAG